MSQAGYTPIQLYFSTTAAAVPVNTNLANGELAINITDGKLYYKDNVGTVRLLASNATSAPVLSFSAGTTGFTPSTATTGAITLAGTLATTNGGTGLTSFTSGGVVYASSSSALATGSGLVFDGTNLGLGVTPNTWYLNSSVYGAFQFGSGSLFYGRTTASSANLDLSANSYLDASGLYRYLFSAETTKFTQSAGAYYWYSAASGTAGNTFSFGNAKMTLDASGRLLVGTTSGSGATMFTVNQPASSTDAKTIVSVATGTNAAYTAFVNTTVTTVGTENSTGGSLVSGSSAYSTVIANNGAYPISFGTNNAERARIDSSGNFLIGSATARSTGSGSGVNLQVEGAPSPANFGLIRNSANEFPARIMIAKTRGTAVGSNTVVQSGDQLGLIEFDGADGTGLIIGASIEAFVDGTPGTNDMPGRLSFNTTPDGSATATERLRIASTGAFGLSGANYGTAGQVLTSNGSGSAPSWQAGGGGGGGTPGGSNTQVQYNSSGSFAGSANFTFNGTGITTGFFAPSSSSAPATGISLPSADTLGFSSASQGNGMYFKTFQIGSSGAYVNQLALGTGVNTAYYSNLYVYALTSTAAQAKSSDGPGQIYSGNNNIPYRSTQVIEASTTGFTSNQYCPVGLESVSRSSGGWQPTQFPTGSFQTFTNIGVYGEAQGASGYPLGAGFYAFAGSYYANATGFYARTYNIAPTSGGSYCYRSDIGPHVFGGNMVGYHSRVVSGQGSNSTYGQTIGWWHSDETANGVGGTAARFEKAGSVVGTITLTTSATAYNTSSDPRLKNITGPVTSDEAKAFVMGLQPKQGTWKVDGSRFCGFLSTDYELIDPSSVSGVAGATEAIGNLIDKDGNVVNAGVVEPTADCLPEGGRWEQTSVKDIYQTLEYGSAAWCANMTAHAQYLQSTIDQLITRITSLENK